MSADMQTDHFKAYFHRDGIWVVRYTTDPTWGTQEGTGFMLSAEDVAELQEIVKAWQEDG